MPAPQQEVTNMALICSLFYRPDFLKSPLLAHATFADLTSIKWYRQLFYFMPEGDCLKEAARVALNTCEGHLDYLSPPHITWSIVNDDWPGWKRGCWTSRLTDQSTLALPLPGMTGSDPAERALNTLNDNITRFHNEENLQHY